MAIPLIKGRDFNERDQHKSSPVIIVSQTFARQFLNLKFANVARLPFDLNPEITVVGFKFFELPRARTVDGLVPTGQGTNDAA